MLYCLMNSSILSHRSHQRSILIHYRPNIDNLTSITGWSSKLHHHSRYILPLEITEIPFTGRVVWFHSLDAMDVHPETLGIDDVSVGGNCSGDVTTGPEDVTHVAPWFG